MIRTEGSAIEGRRSSLVSALLLAWMMTVPLCGCSTWWQRTFAEREIVTEGFGENAASLTFRFPYAWYENQPAQTSMFLSDISPEDLASGGELTGQVAHVQVMWLPRPGWTPARKGCTNTVIRLLVFSRGEVGLYGGGGFAWPWDEPGDPTFGMDVLSSSLSLLERTDGFVDLLSPAEMTGAADSIHDDATAQRMRLLTSQIVTNAFKSVRWVRVWEGAESGAPLAASSERGAQRWIDRLALGVVRDEEYLLCTGVEVDHDEHGVLQVHGAGSSAVRRVADER